MTSSNCPDVLSHGTCTRLNCQFEHNILVCQPCGFIAINQEALTSHLAGRRHQSCVSGRSTTLYCPICEINIDGGNWESHKDGRSHIKHAADKGLSPDVEAHVGTSVPGEKYCELCKLATATSRWNRHLKTEQHLRRKDFASYQAAIEAAEKDKNGIIVEGNFDMGTIDLAQQSRTIKHFIILKTATPDLRVKLADWRLTSSMADANTTFIVTPDSNSRIITSKGSVKLTLTLNQTDIGRYEDRLELILENISSKRQFLISRSIRVVLGDKEDQQDLKASSPYTSRSRHTPRKPETKIVKGKKSRSFTIPYVDRLPEAPIPPVLSATLSEGSKAEIIEKIRAKFLLSGLALETHTKYFKNLLWIEEHRTERDLEKYDLPDVKLRKEGPHYFVEVPGLSEKRPSVLLGDQLLVQRHGAPEGHWFEGYVCVIRRDEVGLQFHKSFKGWSSSQLYYIRFKLNRITLRRQHHALSQQAFKQDHILFPSVRQASKLAFVVRARLQLEYFDGNIAANPQQAQAVRSIVRLPPGSPPFVVFGPFGTGKTSTIVEAMLQILRCDPEASRILACAPSNSAADLITSKLGASLDKEELFRFNAPSRDKKSLPDDILKFSYLKQVKSPNGPEQHFSIPMDKIKQFRVVVSTCISGCVPAGVGLRRGHFTHIFIDEAGQATEPEALTSIKTIANDKTNIVLAGDPKQLGPVLHSPIAQELGLQKSYLERLMEQQAYDIVNHRGVTVMKLLNNYRSHPAILKFPNEQFYNGELMAKAKATKINRYLGCSVLPCPTFPIIFHAIFGKDDREASSPSYFNIDEVTQVKNYVQKLRGDNKYRTIEDDIGIITPYHAQHRKISKGLRKIHAEGIKVGSVEEFQGQERPVIIISTVRSSQELLEYDLRHTLGFVANPRRFNVAITRSQALLIVVGDPRVLSLDPLWRKFLNYVYNSGGWRGPKPDWDTNAEVDMNGGYDKAMRDRARVDMNDFTRRLEALTLMNEEEDGAWVDQAWRVDAE